MTELKKKMSWKEVKKNESLVVWGQIYFWNALNTDQNHYFYFDLSFNCRRWDYLKKKKSVLILQNADREKSLHFATVIYELVSCNGIMFDASAIASQAGIVFLLQVYA